VNLLLEGLVGLVLVLLCAALLLVFMVIYRKRPTHGLRSIQAFNNLRQAIGLAVEDGSRLHISLGKASLNTAQVASALAGLSLLQRIAQLSSISDRPPVATSGDGGLTILSQDTLRATYRSANALDLYDPGRGQMSGPTPMAYIAGALPTLQDENVSANILIGNFGPEVALLADTSEQKNAACLAGSDSLTAQAVLYATARDPLLGEEVFASGAYLQSGRSHPASLRVQDVLRWLVILALLGGIILKLVGVI
jgi:Domain of unknown function (DUF6754)